MQQFFGALERPLHIVNLDPANNQLPYECALDITELVSLQDVMDEFGLGPNGAMIYCLEYLEENFDWLEDRLNSLRQLNHLEDETIDADNAPKSGMPEYVVFDMPGQVELSTNHNSLRNIIVKLEKAGYRVGQLPATDPCSAHADSAYKLAAVNLTDAFHVTSASTYVSILLLSLRTMLQLELPHLNVLSKIDLITSYGDLPFNLDFYTEVQDLSYLQHELEKDPRTRQGRFLELNRAICEIVEDFGLVSFQTLCVEDKVSMAAIVKTLDQMLGYVPARSLGDTHSHSHRFHDHGHGEGEARHQQSGTSMPAPSEAKTANAMLHALPLSSFPSVSEVQERYVDNRAHHLRHEKTRWQLEADQHFERKTEEVRQSAVQQGIKEVGKTTTAL